VIGLIFVYLLLSSVCTAGKEIIEAWLKKRATDLEAAIRELLNDPKGEDLAKKLYEHPLVFGLFRGDYRPARSWGAFLRNWCSTNLPSYIPARNFALALLDVALRPEGVPASVTSDPPTAPSRQASSRWRQWRWGLVTPPGAAQPTPPGSAAAPLPSPQANSTRTLRDMIGDIQNTQLRRALLAFADEAGDDLDHLRAGVEAWFNSAMDRISGKYKRWSQVVILAISVAVTVGLNADTLAICTSLSQDQDTAKRLGDAAEDYVKKQAAGGQQPPAEAVDPRTALKNSLEAVGNLGLPIGWNQNDPRTYPGSDGWGWARKVAGWLLTVLAISLGAPFWFDLLNKFMVVRSTVRPDEKSPEEGPIGKRMSARTEPEPGHNPSRPG
jgi:hypothetical protein